MIEIAICLAIIGIALVAIIGVLPMGLNVQKDNREETIINQDATVFMEYIRNGASSPYGSDLTNYVYAITNNVTGNPFSFGYGYNNIYLTNNARIIGLLSTPEYVDGNGRPIPNLSYANPSYSNHIVACVRSVSGPASEKPPQDNNGTVRMDSFSYKIICENVPVAVYTPPLWQHRAYNSGDYVSYTNTLSGQTTFWQANAPTLAVDEPSLSSLWARILYPQQLAANLHELRLTFLWPLLPNGKTGNGRQTFRTTVAGQIVQTIDTNVIPNQTLYFFQPQSFNNVSAP